MLVARIVVLLAAAGALVAGLVGVPRPGRALPGRERIEYVCPMHSQIAAGNAGECPICRMALVPRADAASTTEGPDAAGWRRSLARVRSRLASREIVAPAWSDGRLTVSALLYDDEAAMLEPRQAAELTRGTEPDAGAAAGGPPPARTAVRRLDEPPRRWDTATSVVRFEVLSDPKRRAPAWRRDEIGWVVLATPVRRILVVPRNAVLPSPAGPYLLVASDDLRTLTRRPVQIGRTVAGQATLVAGASEGERVVAADAFFVDAGTRSAGAAR